MIIDVVICVLGLLLHLAMKWAEAREITPLSIGQYVADKPAQTSVAVISAAATWLVCWQLEWLNPGMSFACGYVGHSIAENIANKYKGLS